MDKHSERSVLSVLERETESPFTPAVYDEMGLIHLDGDPSDVFPLFEAEWRKLWRPSWIQEAIYDPPGDSLSGACYRVLPDGHPVDWEIYVIITYYGRKAMETHYSIVWGHWELRRFEMVCRAAADGGTDNRDNGCCNPNDCGLMEVCWSNECVECCFDSDCPGPFHPYCRLSDHTCICLTDADCGSGVCSPSGTCCFGPGCGQN